MRVRWDTRLKMMRISTVAIIVALILLLLFSAYTVYGNKVGNFVINVDLRSDVRLSLSDQEDLSGQTERLVYSGLTELHDSTYQWLPHNISNRGLGNVSDAENYRFMAYSFYLINNSNRALDCDLDLKLLDTVGDPLGMIRVMLIEGERDTFDESNRIYAMAESSPERKAQLDEDLRLNHILYDTENFNLGDGDLFSVQLMDFAAGSYCKYTVVVWLEGCDPDCTIDRVGARVKMELDITGY